MVEWKALLSDRTIMSSKDVEWRTLPKLPILQIELIIPNNKKRIFLGGFKKYLIISTKYKFISLNKEDMFDSISILGKKNNEVVQITYHRKGKLFQCKNTFPEWKPMVIKTQPALNGKKQFEIVYSKPIQTNIKDWHKGINQQSRVWIA